MRDISVENVINKISGGLKVESVKFETYATVYLGSVRNSFDLEIKIDSKNGSNYTWRMEPPPGFLSPKVQERLTFQGQDVFPTYEDALKDAKYTLDSSIKRKLGVTF